MAMIRCGSGGNAAGLEPNTYFTIINSNASAIHNYTDGTSFNSANGTYFSMVCAGVKGKSTVKCGVAGYYIFLKEDGTTSSSGQFTVNTPVSIPADAIEAHVWHSGSSSIPAYSVTIS